MLDVVPIEGDAMRIAVTVLGLSLLSGCAFTNLTINPPASSVSTQLSGGDKREIVMNIPFADERQIRARCGMKKNSYNMDTASVYCSSEPAVWLARLLAEELKAAGFTVKTDGITDKPNGVKVEGFLLKFFIEPVIGFTTISLETDTHIKLVATSASGLNAEHSFFFKGKNAALTGMDSNFQPSVDDATRKIINDMVSAILTLMNRYPELGRSSSIDPLIRVALIVKEKS
jgi:hypothetical protein